MRIDEEGGHWLWKFNTGKETEIISAIEKMDLTTVSTDFIDAATMAYAEAGDSRSAVRLAREYYELHPDGWSAVRLAWAMLADRQWNSALALAARLQEQPDFAEEASAIRAAAFVGTGAFGQAADELSLIEDVHASDSRLIAAIRVAYARDRGPETVRKLFTDYIQDAERIAVRRLIERLLLIYGLTEELTQLVSYEDEDCESSLVLAARIEIARSSGDGERAREFARLLNERELAHDGTVSFALGNYYYSVADFKAASKYFKLALDHFVHVPSSVVGLADCYAWLAMSELRRWRPRAARVYAEAALLEDPNNKLAHHVAFRANVISLNPVGAFRSIMRYARSRREASVYSDRISLS